MLFPGKAVADPEDCLDIARVGGVGFDLGAQVADVHVNGAGHSFEGVARTIDVHVRNLRTKIESDPANPRYIETVFGIGYRFKLDK
jgi:hypothetical protein